MAAFLWPFLPLPGARRRANNLYPLSQEVVRGGQGGHGPSGLAGKLAFSICISVSCFDLFFSAT